MVSNSFTIRKINKLDTQLRKSKRIKKVQRVLNTEDLSSWVKLPKLIQQSKTDKMKEVILLMAYLGLRVSEAINFNWIKQKLYNKKWAFIIKGKGEHERVVPNIFFDEYINTKAEIARRDPAWIAKEQFTVTRTGVYEHLKILAKDLNWDWTPTPHDFRRSFATRLVCEKNISVHIIRRLLEHSFLITIEKYLQDDPKLIMNNLDKFFK